MTRLTPKKRREFLAALADGADVVDAADAIGMTRQALYIRRRKDDAFAAEWADDHALGTCSGCGAPTSADVCSFCRLSARAQIDLDPTGADGVRA